MAEEVITGSVLSFRLARAEQFARQWRSNAKRLATLANNPRTPALVRADALTEARTAAEIVAQRGAELAELARLRGYSAWQADPKVGPVVVEIQSVEHALNHVADTLRESEGR